eukprot:1097652-Pelagomonas_calceolata.AAC.2
MMTRSMICCTVQDSRQVQPCVSCGSAWWKGEGLQGGLRSLRGLYRRSFCAHVCVAGSVRGPGLLGKGSRGVLHEAERLRA